MRSSDHKPSGSCLVCGKPTDLTVCLGCDIRVSEQAPHLKYWHRQKRDFVFYPGKRFPSPSPRDIPLLKQCGPAHYLTYYIRVWERQMGRCSRCHRVHSRMRVVLMKNTPSIKCLVCSSCFRAKPDREKVTLPKSNAQIIWEAADPLLRHCLVSNPKFAEYYRRSSGLPPESKENLPKAAKSD